MPSSYDQGDTVRMSSTFTDTGGTKTDPTQTKFVYTTPDGTDTVVTRSGTATGSTGNIMRSTDGVYFKDSVIGSSSGAYWYRYSSTGNITAMDEATFRVRHKYSTT